MTRHPLVPPQRLKPVAGAVVRLAVDAPPQPAARGAGIAYVDPQGRALFLKRAADGDHAGTWCFPGGGIEAGETPEVAAVRESREEIGANPYGARSLMAKTAMDGGHYLTYAQPVKHAFTPRLNEEHTEHVWAPLGQPPEPLHPGVRQALSGMAMDEWIEADHPRASNGQFGTGASSVVRSASEAAGSPDAKIAALFSNSLGMKRGDMPQIPKKFQAEFLQELDADTPVTHEVVDAASLKPTQGDYKADLITGIAASGLDPMRGSIVVSSDGYVLDGHHRWAAGALNGQKINAIKVGLPIRQLLAKAEDFNQRHGVERRIAVDAFVEADHPRADNGQFGSGGGGAAATHPSSSAAPQVHPPPASAQAQAITQAPGAQAFMSQGLYNEAKRAIALYSKEEEASQPLTQAERDKAVKDLANHLAAAHAAKPEYDSKLTDIGKKIGAEVLLAKVKGGERLLEKHTRDNAGNPAEMKDLVRGSLIVKSLDEVGPALAEIEKHFKVARVKDRFAKPTNAGYSDLLINVNLPGGIQGEVQIHIPEMLAAKNDLGHALYEIERKLPVGTPLQEQLAELQTRVYGSARSAANQVLESTRSKRLTPEKSQAANSSRDKSSPSRPALDALPYGRPSSDPRFSNAKQVRSGSITTGMLSTSRNRDPSGTSDSFIGASPFPSILPLAQDKAIPITGVAQDDEHWITVNGGEGKGQPLLITGGGVVVGGAGGNLNGKVLDPKSKSSPRASEPTKASKSADIAKALQNRNRSSAASVAQMNRIASNPRLMMAAPTMNDGAPVVTDLEGKGIAKLTGHRDWVVTGKREIAVRYAVVEADQLAASNRADGTKNEDYAKNPDKLVAINNGRTAAMIEAYSRGTADAYKDAIAKAERVHGIKGKDIKAMKAPVLVRIMDAADVDEHIGDESNSTQTLSLSAVEQAQNDATRFDPAGIEYDDDGTPSDASVKGFINAMPAAERQSLSPNGKPTKQAIDRMLAATFHAAYGDSELVGLMAQATDPESRNLINGMSKAAGSMAKLKDAGELDIRELVTGAAKQIINAVRSGVSIKKFLKQGDLLTNSAEDQIAALFAENARSAKAIGEKLTAAANFAYEESQKEGTDMFGDPIPQASREDALEKLHAQS